VRCVLRPGRKGEGIGDVIGYICFGTKEKKCRNQGKGSHSFSRSRDEGSRWMLGTGNGGGVIWGDKDGMRT